MSLKITTPTGLGESEEQRVNSEWDTLDKVLMDLMKEGVFLLNRPTCPQPILSPDILTHATPTQFGVLFAQFEAWKSFTESILAGIDGLILQCENEMRVIAVKMREAIRAECKQTGEKKPVDSVIKDMVENQPRYLALLLQLQNAQQNRFMMLAESTRYGRGLRIVSRYLKIKELEVEEGQRRNFR